MAQGSSTIFLSSICKLAPAMTTLMGALRTLLPCLIVSSCMPALVAANERETDAFIASHKFGPQCKQAAEALETEIGYFDDKGLSNDQRREIADELASKIEELAGKTVDGLADKLE